MKTDPNASIVNDRYELQTVLGQGRFGTTYLAQDLATHQQVAIKVVSLRAVKEWKALDLMERETAVLRNLDHPAIPKYIESFEIVDDKQKTFYLVQAIASGHSLSQWIDQGWKPSEAEVIDIAQQLLHVLSYLQSLTPPVIHRDIKPHNIIRDEQGNICLVDFGSIQDTYRHTVTGGSTIVGTFGYMAPEQYRGQATLATDLYGLGATLIFLLTGKCPSELPEKKFQIDFRAAVSVEPFLGRWLDSLIAPLVENRISTAHDALSMLKGEQPLLANLRQTYSRKKRDRFYVEQAPDHLIVEIPAQGFQSLALRRVVFSNLAITISSAFCLYWLSTSSASRFFGDAIGFLLLVHLISWIGHLVCCNAVFQRTRLLITPTCLFFWQALFLPPLDLERAMDGLTTYSTLIPAELHELQHLCLHALFEKNRETSSRYIGIGRYALGIQVKNKRVIHFSNGLHKAELRQILEEIQLFLTNSTRLSAQEISEITQQ